METRLALTGFLLLCVVVVMGCRKAAPLRSDDPDRTIKVSSTDAEMNAAMTHARTEVDAAIAKLQSGAKNFSVKIPIKDGEDTEYFWLSDVRCQDGVFTGKIDNEPDTVHTVKIGQEVTAPKDGIADWMYLEDGKMHGNYTLRVFTKQMPAAEADKYRRMLAD